MHRPVLERYGEHSDLKPLDGHPGVGEGYRAVRLAVDELLKVLIQQMRADPTHDAAATASLFDPNEDVSIGLTPGVCKSEDVFEEFALLLVCRGVERIRCQLEI